MKQILTYLAIIWALTANAMADDKIFDNGRDANDNFVVAETLTLRCGVSSKNPIITDDCMRRLAYDYKTGKPPEFDSYSDERSAILNEYASAYITKAVVQMVAAGNYPDHINELIKQDPTQTYDLNNDAREKMEFNNKLVSDNTSLFLKMLDLRASQMNFNNVNDILDVLVPSTEINIEDDKYLALPPTE